ncbi:uncharacterized protein LOC128868025 [Anastrepha ludens]|uniref:uncharacterized protein LOC128868025 n=1 Tax=Anastrepha ludens TaxID=28586 RepID=UPI0023B0115B|nr:uncharacterized protein LOC128868025 [Anastrepha ludens]
MELFINEVRKRELLWNKKKVLLRHVERQIAAEKLWEEVADACGISKSTAKCKWRSLRDQFIKELKKVPVYTSGGSYYIEEREKPKWVHFNNLIFLLNTHTPSKQVIDIRSESIIDIRSNDSASSSDDIKSSTEDIAPTIPPLVSVDTTPKYTIPKDTILIDTIPIVTTPKDTIPTDNTFKSIRKIYTLDEVNEPNLCVAQWVEESDVSVYDESKRQVEGFTPPMVVIKPQPLDPTLAGVKRPYPSEEDNDLDALHMADELHKCQPKRSHESNNKQDCKGLPNTVEENENLLFFRSLLPFMSKLDPMQQLRVRMRCQEIMFEELAAKRDQGGLR